MCCTRLALFVPAERLGAAISELVGLRSVWSALHAAVSSLAAAACLQLHGGVDTHFLLCATFSSLYLRALCMPAAALGEKAPQTVASPQPAKGASGGVGGGGGTGGIGSTRGVCALAALAALTFGLSPPILGLQNMSALTMYSNSKLTNRHPNPNPSRNLNPTRHAR